MLGQANNKLDFLLLALVVVVGVEGIWGRREVGGVRVAAGGSGIGGVEIRVRRRVLLLFESALFEIQERGSAFLLSLLGCLCCSGC
jgi:hypothetical protein